MPSSAVRRTAPQSSAALPAPLRNCAGQAAASARRAALRTQMPWSTPRWSARGSNRTRFDAAYCSNTLPGVIGRSALASGVVHCPTSRCDTESCGALRHAAQKSTTAERVAPHHGVMRRTTLNDNASRCTAMHRMYSTASRLSEAPEGDEVCDGQLPLVERGPAMPGGAVHRTASGASSASGAMAGSVHSTHKVEGQGRKGK